MKNDYRYLFYESISKTSGRDDESYFEVLLTDKRYVFIDDTNTYKF